MVAAKLVLAICVLLVGSANGQTTSLLGGGSSAAAPYIQAAINNATAASKTAGQTISISYNTTSSTTGRASLTAKQLDFAASDVPFPAASYPSGYSQIPFALGIFSVATSYAGLSNFSLDATTLAGIYSCKLTTWDQVSTALGGSLKATGPITPVARNDSSGTTQIITGYLATAGAGAWALGVNSTISWPSCVKTASGSAAVASLVKSTSNAIGYVEYGIAQNSSLPSAALKNSGGQFVSPGAADFSSSTIAPPNSVASSAWDSLTFTNTTLATGYPASGVEYIIVPTDLSQIVSKGNSPSLLKQFISYLLSSQAQAATRSVGFAPLPSNILSVASSGTNALSGVSGNTNFGLPSAAAPPSTSTG